MTRLKDLYEYLDYLDNCSDGQFLKFVDAMEKRGYKFVTQYVHDYDYPHVTHCKGCKWYEFDEKLHCGLSHGIRMKDDYCSDAERRTDERFNQQTGGD